MPKRSAFQKEPPLGRQQVLSKGHPLRGPRRMKNYLKLLAIGASFSGLEKGPVSGSVALMILLLSLTPAQAFPGASVPWTTYEAENMTIGGGAILGPQYGPNVVETEASGRKCVRLNGTGQYVEFTNQSTANAMVVRYSVPDTADGAGTNYTISLYINGAFVEKLAMTSKYSWLYGSYSFTNFPPAGSPRNFFDETRTNGLSINPGDRVRLQKDGTDTATNYIIDLVDFENVAAPPAAPTNSLSVTSYGAVGDGISDCTTALQNCVNAAQAQSKVVWIPAGTYLLSGIINLPSNTTLQGAGMWVAKLIGNASLYNTTPSSRINLNGTGGNIHLADFAIIGFLNYRNDSEGNDGIGGSYGTGSTISRLWIEHTKAAMWIVNSSGLVVDGCRFRNTLADGINLNFGMRNTTVTNCTARGTGDDCFAIWPAPQAQTYAPGLNVFTHCTAQSPFLANGGAIYGGASNRIEDCLFQDMPYGCGILVSTTFPVGTNVFSGITVAQRSDLIRCGGYDGGFGWRAAVQLCLDHGSLSGVNLNNLNITNSISDGFSIIAPGSSISTGLGTLSNAVVSGLNLSNYGIGVSGRNGLWARNDAIGSMTVTNSTLIECRNDSPYFTFNFVSSFGPAVALAFTTQPSSAIAGVPFGQQPVLKTMDIFGNPSTLGLPASLPIFVGLINSTGTLLGTTNYDIGTGGSNGVVTFSNLAINTAGSGNQLIASPLPSAVGSPVPGMSIWLDASVAASVLTNASGIVTNWLDQSGHGNNFNTTIGSAGNGIRYASTELNGRKAVMFNATSGSAGTELKNTTYNNTSPSNSIFVVARKTMAGTSEGGYQAVFATWAGSVADYLSSGSYTLNYNIANTTPRVYRNGVADNNCAAIDSSTNYIVFEYMADGTANAGNNSFWSGLAGGELVGSQNASALAVANFNVVASSVGGGMTSSTAVNNPFAGSIAEVLVYNSALNTSNRASVVSYLRSKWIAPNAPASATSAAFNVSATPPPAQPITRIAISPPNSIALKFATTPGFVYHVEVTTSLAPVVWTTVAGSVTNASGNSVTLTDTNLKGPQSFYRTVSP